MAGWVNYAQETLQAATQHQYRHCHCQVRLRLYKDHSLGLILRLDTLAQDQNNRHPILQSTHLHLDTLDHLALALLALAQLVLALPVAFLVLVEVALGPTRMRVLLVRQSRRPANSP